MVARRYAAPTLLNQPHHLRNPTALTSPLTILHLLAPAPVGGLETVVSTLAAAQRRAGHTVIVAPTLSGPGDGWNFTASLEHADVALVPLIVPRRGYLRERSLIRGLCRSKAVNVVHTHGYRSDIVGGHAGREERVPIVTTVHGFTGGGMKNRAYEALQRYAFRRFDAVVAVSQPQADQLRAGGVSDHRIHVIPNALAPHATPLARAEARRALELPPEGLLAGWVGRISREKGVDIFIDALTSIGDRVIQGAILGDGPERPAEQARAESIAPARFLWLGAVPDAARYFAAFDLFVMSSRTEGLPMVLLEAMAAGVPIVTTNVGGIPQLLSPAEGVLVPPEDPKALASAMRAALDDRAAAAARADAARRRQHAEFDVGPWSDRYEALYRHLIALRARAGARA
ncbi:MAG TPA: glycosyltransferase [Gemmatimonadaceae bacterium]|nr:glycosyltransferase [Gemmatimonadaceae bacterium]